MSLLALLLGSSLGAQSRIGATSRRVVAEIYPLVRGSRRYRPDKIGFGHRVVLIAVIYALCVGPAVVESTAIHFGKQ